MKTLETGKGPPPHSTFFFLLLIIAGSIFTFVFLSRRNKDVENGLNSLENEMFMFKTMNMYNWGRGPSLTNKPGDPLEYHFGSF